MSEPVTLEGELMFPNLYLKAVELKGKDVTLTITQVEFSDLRMVTGATKRKAVVHFAGTEKKLVLNKTNGDTIGDLYGTEATGWIGKRITLFPSTCPVGKKTNHPCIRIRPRVPAEKGAA
jgi:hypothetical protein